MKAVYTDLDSLFDTRVVMLGLLTNQGEYSVGKHNYHKRVRDNFGTLSDIIFNHYYKYRSDKLLNLAPATRIQDIIKDYILDTLEKDLDDTEIVIFINVSPYKLSQAGSTLLLTILNRMFPNVTIKFINRKTHELDVEWVRGNIDLFISYYAIEWLNFALLDRSIYQHPLINVLMLAPFRLIGTVSSNSVNDKLIKDTKAFFRTICDFHYIDISAFCGKK